MPNCYLRGKKISFSDDEFIASGGQGEVYGRGRTAYKIYHDPSTVIPVKKIEELQVLDIMNILGPRDILYSAKGTSIGFTMPLVSGTIALCRLFANGFRRTKGVTPEMSVKLVESMVSITQFVHDKRCLVADGNENNYLVSESDLITPFFIDVDNYCTPHFMAEFLNPSVRDYQATGFSTLTDWFALAIVACQIFIGLHPFKGNHPQFNSDDLESRMRKHVSIFNKDVKVPPPTRDYSNIPRDYYQWFIDLFEKGKRMPPPKVAGLLNVTAVQVQILQTTLKFITSLLHKYGADIVWASERDGKLVVFTKNKELWVDKNKWKIPKRRCEVVLFDGSPVIATIEKGLLKLRSLDKHGVFVPNVSADQCMVVENTLYVKQGGNLIEIRLTRLGDRIIATLIATWKIMPLSSVLYDNVLLQNTLGKIWGIIPKPGKCHMIALPELNGVRIVSGKCVQNVCMFSGYKNNKLSCFRFFFNDKFDGYNCIEEPTDDLDVNFTVLPNKVAVQWDGKKMYIIYPNMKMDIVEDKGLPVNMTLLPYSNKLMFFTREGLYYITSKK